MRWCVGGYLVSLGVGIACARYMIVEGEWVRGVLWERDLLEAVHRIELSVPLDWIMLIVPWFGTNITLMPLTFIAAVWLARRGQAVTAIHLVIVQVGTLTLSALLKAFYERPRPDLWEPRGQFAWASYPSGHAITTVAVLFTVAILLRRTLGWRWPFVAAIAMLIITCYSRLYLGVHWPSDVIAGLLIGVVWLLSTLVAFRPAEAVGPGPAAGAGPAFNQIPPSHSRRG